MTNENEHPVPVGKGKRWWGKLSREARELHTDWRFEANLKNPKVHRNMDIQDALGVSVGTIAGMKNRWRKQRDEKSIQQRADPIPEIEPTAPLVPSELLLKKGEPETGTCVWPTGTGSSLKKPKLCEKKTEPGERLCAEHKTMARGQR